MCRATARLTSPAFLMALRGDCDWSRQARVDTWDSRSLFDPGRILAKSYPGQTCRHRTCRDPEITPAAGLSKVGQTLSGVPAAPQQSKRRLMPQQPANLH